MNWKLDRKPVNGATVVASMALRVAFFVLAIGVFSAAQPWLSFSQVVGIAVAYLLLMTAKTATVTLSD